MGQPPPLSWFSHLHPPTSLSAQVPRQAKISHWSPTNSCKVKRKNNSGTKLKRQAVVARSHLIPYPSSTPVSASSTIESRSLYALGWLLCTYSRDIFPFHDTTTEPQVKIYNQARCHPFKPCRAPVRTTCQSLSDPLISHQVALSGMFYLWKLLQTNPQSFAPELFASKSILSPCSFTFYGPTNWESSCNSLWASWMPRPPWKRGHKCPITFFNSQLFGFSSMDMLDKTSLIGCGKFVKRGAGTQKYELRGNLGLSDFPGWAGKPAGDFSISLLESLCCRQRCA